MEEVKIMEEVITRTNVYAVINVTLGNQNKYYRQYSVYIKSEENADVKINTVIAVARMLDAVSIYVYLGEQLSLVHLTAYKDKTLIDEICLKTVYDALTSRNAVNIFI